MCQYLACKWLNHYHFPPYSQILRHFHPRFHFILIITAVIISINWAGLVSFVISDLTNGGRRHVSLEPLDSVGAILKFPTTLLCIKHWWVCDCCIVPNTANVRFIFSLTTEEHGGSKVASIFFTQEISFSPVGLYLSRNISNLASLTLSNLGFV